METIISGTRIATEAEVLMAIALCGFADQITRVLSGKCPTGGDYWGERWARQCFKPVEDYPAEWLDVAPTNTLGIPPMLIERHGGQIYDIRAGHRRNERMAMSADALIATWDGKSTGTKDMIVRALHHKLRMFVLVTRDDPKAADWLLRNHIPHAVYKLG